MMKHSLAIVSLILSLAVPSRAETIRFAVIGDFGNGSMAAGSVAKMVKTWAPDFILTTGDNNYGGARDYGRVVGRYYREFINPYGGVTNANRFFPCLGNHDWEHGKFPAYTNYFSLPGNERYYDFTNGPVHFFALDSESIAKNPQEAQTQKSWLQDRLTNSRSPWNVVFFHHPPYSSGRYHGSTKKMRWPFAEWGAHVVLSGHEHNYERVHTNGVVYFVNGLGGAFTYAFGNNPPLTCTRNRYDASRGAMRVVATETNMTFQFYSARNRARPIDEWTLWK
jgi:hypothetical protein